MLSNVAATIADYLTLKMQIIYFFFVCLLSLTQAEYVLRMLFPFDHRR